jgi:hypothetical protein
MKTSIKKVSRPVSGSDFYDDEWRIYLNGVTIAMAWRKDDAKLIAKALRKYKKKNKHKE